MHRDGPHTEALRSPDDAAGDLTAGRDEQGLEHAGASPRCRSCPDNRATTGGGAAAHTTHVGLLVCVVAAALVLGWLTGGSLRRLAEVRGARAGAQLTIVRPTPARRSNRSSASTTRGSYSAVVPSRSRSSAASQVARS